MENDDSRQVLIAAPIIGDWLLIGLTATGYYWAAARPGSSRMRAR